jgi:hypothetical protein
MLLLYFGVNALLWGLNFCGQGLLTHILFSDGLISAIVQRAIPEQDIS